jgi:ferrochelatase
MDKTGFLLVNLGTPLGPDVPSVRRYLRQFLSDPRVIDIPAPARWALLNLIILPTRPPKSAEAYEKVWTDRGSPLLFHSQDLRDKVQARLGDSVQVELGMRYQEPSLAGALQRFSAAGVDRIIMLPLFPQYSSAAWGSAVQEAYEVAARLWNVPSITTVPPFYDHPAFIHAFAEVARPVLDAHDPDVVLLSYHGLPERHCTKSDESGGKHCLASAGCCDAIVWANRYCYRAQCMATSRLLTQALGLGPADHEVTFQSRLGRTPWIRPYTDVRIVELAKAGKKRAVVLSPAFVADCLETLEEIALRLRDDFLAHGGEELVLVPSLNATDPWVDAVVQLYRETAEGAPRDRARSGGSALAARD